MPSTIELLHHSTLTRTVNERKPPRRFLSTLLRGRLELVATDTVEIGVWNADRKSAPFVEMGGEAVLVTSQGSDKQTVKIPHIRIKTNVDPDSLLTDRQPGSPIFIPPGRAGQSALLSQAERVVANKLQELDWRLANTEEWMYAQMLDGTITYQVADQANFTITYNVAAPSVITTKWDNAASKPSETVIAARNAQAEFGLAPRVAIMGASAAAAFRANAEVMSLLDNRRVEVGGTLELHHDLTQSGGLYLGRFMGVEWWEYSRSLEGPTGVSAALVGDKLVHFIDTSPEADFRTYYGPIKDIDAMEQGSVVARRFSKSWTKKDPSARVFLMSTRPLPVPARPAAITTYQVLA